jgi:TctA family transporter
VRPYTHAAHDQAAQSAFITNAMLGADLFVGPIAHAAGEALLIIVDPHRLVYLVAGVCVGLALGILPGIGGIAGMALLLPFTYNMETHAAFALLLGMGAATTTADPIAAILFGVPGHAASAATTLDGYPMTKRGEAGRALGAAYMSALMGGLFGAALLGFSIPILRPFMLYIGSPELLALAVFGISMVSVLSGNKPLRGLAIACFGMMLSMIGSDQQTGTMRWTLNSLYLWEGLPLVPLTLGIFALPELCDLAISRSAVFQGVLKIDAKSGMVLGIKDCFANWFLVLRCSWIGAAMGAIPGIGAAVIDWISYGHALRTEKGAQRTFGTGDVRGVIAAESATNAKEGGALVPTVAFGVPASASMAILLGAFLIHGLVPGPDMLTKHLDITYSMVWSIAIANIVGSGLCFLFSGQLAKLSTLRYTLIMPVVLSLVYIGAFEGTRQWGDLYSLLAFGVLGWGMKHFKWARPPLVLGFILGKIIERYMFISIERYGAEWILRPIVIVFFGLAAMSLLRPLFQDLRSRGIRRMLPALGRPKLAANQLFSAGLLGLFCVMVINATSWNFDAKVVPLIVGTGAIVFSVLNLLNEMFGKSESGVVGAVDQAKAEAEKLGGTGVHERIHMDIGSNLSHLSTRTILLRGGVFFGWMGGFLGSMAVIGLIPTVPLFIAGYMRLEGRERWRLVVPMALVMTLFIYGLFDRLLAVPWPPTLMGNFFPVLKMIPSV